MQQNDIHFTCPHCRRHYMTELDQLKSETNYFECSMCHIEFSFQKSKVMKKGVEYHAPLHSDLQTTQKVNLEKSLTVETQTCGAGQIEPTQSERFGLKKADSGICTETGISIEADSQLRIQWAKVMEDFDNLSVHNEFILLCLQHRLLDFGIRQYQNLASVMGGDQLIKDRLRQMTDLQLSWLAPAERTDPRSWSQEKLKKTLGFLPFLIGLALIFVGSTSSSLRNLVGVGVACLTLYSGLYYFWKS